MADNDAPESLPRSSPTNTEDKLRNQVLAQLVQALKTLFPRVAGTFTLTAAASITVPQPATTSTSFIQLTPMNASAGTLMGSNKALYVSARTPGTSFTLTTASGVAAAGGEQFSYTLINLV